MRFHAVLETWPIAGEFRISRGSRTEARVVVVTLESEGSVGRGECVPISRYGESIEQTIHDIETTVRKISDVSAASVAVSKMKGGAARNALDCAMWDWRCKSSGSRIGELLGTAPLKPLTTAYTISLSDPATMEQNARANAHRQILKIKVGTQLPVECVEAVRRGAPNSSLIVDANEAWAPDEVPFLLDEMARLNVLLVEQPLSAHNDALLGDVVRPVPVFADESFHGISDISSCLGKYDGVNIKLDKTGGLTAARQALSAARQANLQIMVGCMVATSLAIAPAMVLAQEADYVDLDAPLLLARDRPSGIQYDGSSLLPFTSALWG